MKVDLKIGGIATSSSRARASALVREAVAKTNARSDAARRPSRAADQDERDQPGRGN